MKNKYHMPVYFFYWCWLLGGVSALGVRGENASDRKVLLMSASSKLPLTCSPTATATGPKTYSKTLFFPLAAYGVVQPWCNFIMCHLCETNSISHCQGDAGHGEESSASMYCYRHLRVRWLGKLGEV